MAVFGFLEIEKYFQMHQAIFVFIFVNFCYKIISQQARQTMSPQQLGPNHDTKITNIQKDIPILEQKLKDAQYKAASAIYSGVQVLQRHHFSSKLQRMSVVCKCENTTKNGAKGEKYCSSFA